MEPGTRDLDPTQTSALAALTAGEDRNATHATRDALWYAVGVLLALLVGAAAFVFCFSGRWIR